MRSYSEATRDGQCGPADDGSHKTEGMFLRGPALRYYGMTKSAGQELLNRSCSSVPEEIHPRPAKTKAPTSLEAE